MIWKLHFELAQAEERAVCIAAQGLMKAKVAEIDALPTSDLCTRLCRYRDHLLHNARLDLIRALLTCQWNLSFKVWLASSRLELLAGHPEVARAALVEAMKDVPVKAQAQVLLECARVEEYSGNIAGARRILVKSLQQLKGEWKLHQELIFLEARQGRYVTSLKAAQQAIVASPGAARLWVILIQLCHRFEQHAVRKMRPISADSPINILNSTTTEEQHPTATTTTSSEASCARDHLESTHTLVVPSKDDLLLKALLEVPKSGEVWCEGGRCCLNPLVRYSFDLSVAQRNLNFALQFTPQYGDTFLEYLKLEMLCQVLLPRVLSVMGLPLVPFIERFLAADPEGDLATVLEDPRALELLSVGIEHPFTSAFIEETRSDRRDKLRMLMTGTLEFPNLDEPLRSTIVTKSLERRCINADPNYGTDWYYCRHSPLDSTSTVLQTAQSILTSEIISYQPVYNQAIFAYIIKSLCAVRYKTFPTYTQGGTVRTLEERRRSKSMSKYEQSKQSNTLPSSTSSSRSLHGRSASAASKSSLAQAYLSAPLSQSHEVIEATVAHTEGTGDESDEVDMLNLCYLNPQYQGHREADLLADVEQLLTPATTVAPVVIDGTDETTPTAPIDLTHALCYPLTPEVTLPDGTTTSISDHITCLVIVNRIVYRHNSDLEDRRMALFGSDRIHT